MPHKVNTNVPNSIAWNKYRKENEYSSQLLPRIWTTELAIINTVTFSNLLKNNDASKFLILFLIDWMNKTRVIDLNLI